MVGWSLFQKQHVSGHREKCCFASVRAAQELHQLPSTQQQADQGNACDAICICPAWRTHLSALRSVGAALVTAGLCRASTCTALACPASPMAAPPVRAQLRAATQPRRSSGSCRRAPVAMMPQGSSAWMSAPTHHRATRLAAALPTSGASHAAWLLDGIETADPSADRANLCKGASAHRTP